MTDGWEAFDLAVCRWILKLIAPEDLPDAAVVALAAGCESPSLVRLATMDDATWSEFPPAVKQLFDERGTTVPSYREAVKLIGDDLLHQVAAGELDVRTGTHELYLLTSHLQDQLVWKDLAAFAGFDDAFYLADQGISGTEPQVREDALRWVHDLIARGGVLAQAEPET